MSKTYQFTSTTADGDTIEFKLEIDVEEIAHRLVPRLRKSKRGKASAMHGAIKATEIKDSK